PTIREDACFRHVDKLLRVQKLIAQATVEGLRVAVLPGRPRRDVQRLGFGPFQPPPQDLSNELRPIVAPQVLRHATYGKQLGHTLHYILRGDAARPHQRQTPPRLLVYDRELMRGPRRDQSAFCFNFHDATPAPVKVSLRPSSTISLSNSAFCNASSVWAF